MDGDEEFDLEELKLSKKLLKVGQKWGFPWSKDFSSEISTVSTDFFGFSRDFVGISRDCSGISRDF